MTTACCLDTAAEALTDRFGLQGKRRRSLLISRAVSHRMFALLFPKVPEPIQIHKRTKVSGPFEGRT